MLVQKTNQKHVQDTWKTRISYLEDYDLISIEHFAESGKLLSKIELECEDALDFAKSITEVVDQAIGVK
jgi:hypothetical protein